MKLDSINMDKLKLFIESNVFLIILFSRCVSAVFNLIWDCDETFNYWEPLHFVLFGDGFQTWEYSPTYSLRSYLYIYLNAAPVWLFKNHVSKITLFYLLRFVFAAVSSYAETALFKSLLKLSSADSTYKSLAWYYISLSVFNVGMFLSSTGFLPSTFAMYLVTLAYAAWARNSTSPLAVFSIGLAVLLGWPFAIILGLPIAFDFCFSNNFLPRVLKFFKFTILFGASIVISMLIVDSFFFGRLVLAPLNIVLYNVFPSNPNIGPDIYGREPLSFYLLNCLLNFNVLFPLSLASLLFLCLDYLFIKQNNHQIQTTNRTLRIFVSSLFLWFAVFFTRPHKEERFLYPVYTVLLVAASVTLCLLDKWLKNVKLNGALSVFCIVLHAVFSMSRGVGLINNYSASMHIYHVLNQPQIKFGMAKFESNEEIFVCVAKEWHRFPSSFFIPENVETSAKRQKWRLAFLESDFKGQLPGRFNETMKLIESTRYIDPFFNDENKEVPQRYLTVAQCHFIIDTDQEENDSSENLFFNRVSPRVEWRTLLSMPFLDQDRSPRISRAFYIPRFSPTYNKFTFFKIRARV